MNILPNLMGPPPTPMERAAMVRQHQKHVEALNAFTAHVTDYGWHKLCEKQLRARLQFHGVDI